MGSSKDKIVHVPNKYPKCPKWEKGNGPETDVHESTKHLALEMLALHGLSESRDKSRRLEEEKSTN